MLGWESPHLDQRVVFNSLIFDAVYNLSTALDFNVCRVGYNLSRHISRCVITFLPNTMCADVTLLSNAYISLSCLSLKFIMNNHLVNACIIT